MLVRGAEQVALLEQRCEPRVHGAVDDLLAGLQLLLGRAIERGGLPKAGLARVSGGSTSSLLGWGWSRVQHTTPSRR